MRILPFMGFLGGYGLLSIPLMIITYIFGAFFLVCEVVGFIVVIKWIFNRKKKP